MNARLAAALTAARIAAALTRTLAHGGGTVLPGHVAARIDPRALATLASRLREGSVLISGTNGKTTTARMLASIATAADLRPVHNRAGANLPAGILSTLASGSSLHGRPTGDLGIFEVDEAHVPAVRCAVLPRALVLTNLFRDQLDRYGEIDYVGRAWGTAIASLGSTGALVVNVDDPVLAHLAGSALGAVVGYGVDDRALAARALPHEADRRLCPACGSRLGYAHSYYSHLGDYRCDGCGWARPQPRVSVTRVLPTADGGSRLTLTLDGVEITAELPLPGLHNAYNAAAAVGAAIALGIAPPAIVAGLADVRGAFGRHERIAIGAGSFTLALVKNPVGFNQALRTALPKLGSALIAINDLLADGTDVSWLWDVDFELLANSERSVVCAGLRAHDLAVRLKYAGVESAEVVLDLNQAVDRALAAASNGADVVAFCTYTATLELRRLLHRRGLVPPFWEN